MESEKNKEKYKESIEEYFSNKIVIFIFTKPFN
jgi:hypothetical protein